MHIKFRNVNDAFKGLVQVFQGGTTQFPILRASSRNGTVKMLEEPVTITYRNPLERVLFNAARDVNPFSLLYEALYMLSGRKEVAPLVYYTPRFQEYSDDGETLNGSYGYRWRHYDKDAEDIDQLEWIIRHLRGYPDSRRAVLQMWDTRSDLMEAGFRLLPQYQDKLASKDICCNLSVLFSLRNKAESPAHEEGGEQTVLDITVFNRSNDLIWGALGANYLTFSVLLEYVAAHLGVGVGVYHQVSNNLHVYESNWKPEEWLTESQQEYGKYYQVPLVQNPITFDKEVVQYVERHQRDAVGTQYSEPFLQHVAQPMSIAFHYYKRNDLKSSISVTETILADDWRIVSRAWLERRLVRRGR